MTTPDDDDERTVIQNPSDPRVAAGASLPGEFADALPAGTRLHEFEIGAVIGQGGFGIVYLAQDLTLARRVAIKEYMPSALAARTHALTVAVRSSRHAETFAAGLRSFVNEARLLAQFDHPSLLKVHRFWEANGTAYMVMPYYAGVTLTTQLAELGEPPDEQRLRALLYPLLDALALLHDAHCYHRDIAPDNILMLPDGTPLLLDFGAARRVIGDMTQALTVILKTGYAPVEQYGAMPELSQGAWTDLYALGSVVEFAITGRTPPQAVARYITDKRVPLAERAAGRYGDAFLRAIDRSLAVLPKDRPQSVAEMKALLAPPSPTPPHARSDPGRSAGPLLPPASTPPGARHGDPRVQRRRVAIAGATVSILVVAVWGGRAWVATPRAPAVPPATLTSPTAPASAASAALATEEQAARREPTAPIATPLPAAPTAEPTADTAPPTPPVALPDRTSQARVRTPQATWSQKTGAPPGRLAAHAPAASPRVPNKTLLDARCADIIQRVSLGEPLSAADKSILQRECEP